MKNILMLLVLLTSEKTCGQQEQLPLLKATSQAWSGGAAGSGRGTNYEIFWEFTTAQTIHSIHFGCRKEELR